MSTDVKDTEAQEELKDKVNAGDVKEEKETKEKHAKAKKEDKDQKIEELGQKLSEINDKYLRLSAEFDNYRKRTLKERMELTKNAGEQILEKINSYFGYPAVADIRLTQGGAAPRFSSPAPFRPPEPREQAEINALTSDIEDEALRNAAAELGLLLHTSKK